MRKPTEAIDNNWLNHLGKSHLHEPVTMMLDDIHQSIRKGSLDQAEEGLQKMLDLRPSLKSPLEKAEATVMAALAHYEMYDRQEAIHLLKEARQLYGRNQHYTTVVQWMMGAIYWEDEALRDQGLQEWCQCSQTFSDLAARSINPDDAHFYLFLAGQIQEDMQNRLCSDTGPAGAPEPGGAWTHEFEPDPGAWSIPPDEQSTSGSPTDAPRDGSQGGRPTLARLDLLPIVEKIPVEGSAPAGQRPHATGKVEVDRVLIAGRPYRMVSLRGLGKAFTLRSGGYVVVKVTGDSMNRPDRSGRESINPGDYVLLHLQKDASDGDIVAAEIEGVDTTASLKRLRIRKDGNEYILEPQSTNSIHRPYAFVPHQPGYHIRGVVVVIFKPLGR